MNNMKLGNILNVLEKC